MHNLFDELFSTNEKEKIKKNSSDNDQLNAPKILKKFYKSASYKSHGDGFLVYLDQMVAKTPFKNEIFLPNENIAATIVDEFLMQNEVINPGKMPFLRITNTVLDGIEKNYQPLLEDLLKYISGDMLLYRADGCSALNAYEKKYWNPVVETVEDLLYIEFEIATGILPKGQKQITIHKISDYLQRKIEKFSESERAFAIAAFHMLTSLSHSILLTICVLEEKISFDQFEKCAFLEENWTAKQYGKDEEAEKRKASILQDMKAAFHLLKFLKN